jgi:MoaA/NifB/PqqE/SkfB family radical SAM enzyme
MITVRFILTRFHLVFALLPLLTFRKVFNLLHAIAYFMLKKDRTVEHPPILLLTLTTDCNYTCRMCLKSSKWKSTKGALINYRKPKEMDFAVLRELLREHANYLAVVKLQGGEPLHYSSIVELVDLLNELKIPFDILTNGSLLTEELCKKLVGGYCFNISISLDAGSNETYRYLRRGGELPHVLSNLRRLNEIKEERASSRPMLNASMCTFSENIGEVSELVEICSQYKIPSLTVGEGFDYDTAFTQPHQLARNNKERFREELVKARSTAKQRGIILRLRFPCLAEDSANSANQLPKQVGFVPPKDCLNLYASVWLLADFNAVGCSNSAISWGNIQEHGLQPVWNDPDGIYALARRNLKERKVPVGCEGCIYTGSFLS